jgi:hydrogenase expression/formation protein HypE
VCDILGLDPLFLANEGKMALFCPLEEAERVLTAMKGHPLGRDAAVIGAVGETRKGRLILRTAVGGSRVVDLPTGELVPRIC